MLRADNPATTTKMCDTYIQKFVDLSFLMGQKIFGMAMGKCVSEHMQTEKAQISLHIRAV